MEVEIEEKSYLPQVNEITFLNIFGDTKISFMIVLVIIIVVYVFMFFVLGKTGISSDGNSSNLIIFFLEIALWVILIYVIYINLQRHDNNNFDFQTKMVSLFDSRLSELNVEKSDKVKNSDKCIEKDNDKEVFHIANNKFTFEEARDICESYGARLANYDEIETAYEKGANWCSYGWSQDKLALFPTQKALYNQLKTIPGHENDCGRPGINGGYFKSKLYKFGANCYGVKPKPTEKDKQYTHAINHSPDIDDKNVKSIYDEYIIAPFNKDKWTSK
tara:strand:+ start:1413 stop:2237 length:825 start_codon:yes stop_codon:yes gene_type:complete